MKKADLPLDPDRPLMRWGPIPGHLYFMSEFNEACFSRWHTLISDIPFPSSILLFHEGRTFWLNDLEEIRSFGISLFKRFILPEEIRGKLYTEWKSRLPRLQAFGINIECGLLSTLSAQDFLSLWHDFHEELVEFFLPTLIPEFGNYGSDHFLEERLRPYTKEASELASLMEILTAPERLSFFQEEEISLAETTDLDSHQARYYWLKNSYAEAQILPVAFFAERKDSLSPHLRKEHENRLLNTKERKGEVISKYNLPSSIVNIAQALRIAIEWQDERKKYIFQMIHYKQLLLSEASTRLHESITLIQNLGYQEIEDLLPGTHDTPSLKGSGERAFLYSSSHQRLTHSPVEGGAKITIEEMWKTYLHEHASTKTKDLRGTSACIGDGLIVRGTVRIVLDPRDTADFRTGDILVAAMTSPDYIFVMKQAGAIVTDAGGLTSHAAIVSRELQTPCIVGTKVATKFLKDGDVVEVDAAKGTIHLI